MKSRFALPAVAVLVATIPVYAQTGTAVIDKPVTIPNKAVIGADNGEFPDNILVNFAETFAHYQVTVLVFVSNQCGVTWMYADKIARLEQDYKNKGVGFLAVHSSYQETHDEMRLGLKQHKVPIELIDDKPTQALADYFGASVTPYFVVIDHKGILRYKGPYDKLGGSMPESKRPQYLRPALDAVLAGKPVATKTARAIGCEITRRRK